MEQVGTVYTAQGFEFDYIGVIFGNDLVYDADKQHWKSISQNSEKPLQDKDCWTLETGRLLLQ